MLFLSRALGCTALSALVGCGELPLAPETLAGTYALVAVDGQTAPAVLAGDAERTILLVADTITFERDGDYFGRSCERRVDHVIDEATDACFDHAGRFMIRVRRIELTPAIVPGTLSLTIGIRSATLNGDRLMMSDPVSGSTRTYARSPR